MTAKPRLLILALVAYLIGSLVSATPADAATMTYNRSGAVAYANRWSQNGANLMNPQAYRLATTAPILSLSPCTAAASPTTWAAPTSADTRTTSPGTRSTRSTTSGTSSTPRSPTKASP